MQRVSWGLKEKREKAAELKRQFLKISWSLMKDTMKCSILFIQKIGWNSCANAAFEKNETNWRIWSSNSSAIEADGRGELKCCACFHIPALSFCIHKCKESFHFRIFSLLTLVDVQSHFKLFSKKKFEVVECKSLMYGSIEFSFEILS